MFADLIRQVLNNLLESGALIACLFFSVVDVAAASWEAAKNHTFVWARLGEWVETKLLAVAGIAISFIIASVYPNADVLTIPGLTGTAFTTAASVAATTYVASQVASIYKHLMMGTIINEPVPEEPTPPPA